MILRARAFRWEFSGPPLVMGIVNVTPDSFSDGGRHATTDAAVEHALKLVTEGADLIDVGGESTRPGATPVPEDEELRRVIPVIERLAGRTGVALSIDTMKPAVARAALTAGASLVNDVAANRNDEAMWRVVAEIGAGYVVMHMHGSPATMQHRPRYEDVVVEVGKFFQDRLDRLAAAGVTAEQVVLDPGLGFGKTLEHNLQLLGAMRGFTRWGRPLLVGASRKSFIGKLLDDPGTDRLPASLACAVWAVEAGARIVRVHDVQATVQALRMHAAMSARMPKSC